MDKFIVAAHPDGKPTYIVVANDGKPGLRIVCECQSPETALFLKKLLEEHCGFLGDGLSR